MPRPLSALLLLPALLLSAGAGAPAASAAARPVLIAVEVRVGGDAEPWRWWCGPPADPLAEGALAGLVEGMARRGGPPLRATLPRDLPSVHPMYCRGHLDPAQGANLAGLLGADRAVVGTLEIAMPRAWIEPALIRVDLRWTFTGAGTPDPPQPATSAAMAAHGGGLGEAIREAAVDLGLDLRPLLRPPEVAARPTGPSLLFLVQGLDDPRADLRVAEQVQARFPEGYQVRPLAIRGDGGVLLLESPPGHRPTDLLASLQQALVDPSHGSPPLVFEGMEPSGLPRFAAVDEGKPEVEDAQPGHTGGEAP